jgi:PAS domain S-box-containing protein
MAPRHRSRHDGRPGASFRQTEAASDAVLTPREPSQDDRAADRTLDTLLQELRTYHEELTAQNEQLREAQAQLAASRDRYADLYDFAPVAFVTLDQNGVIRELNLGAATLLGSERIRAEGLPFVGFTEDKRVFAEFLQRCRRYVDGEIPAAELKLQGPSGVREVSVICSPRRSANGEQPEFLTAIVDVTERNRLAREQERAVEDRERSKRREAVAEAATAAKDQFLAQLSHELRTPLTPVLAVLTDPAFTARMPADVQDTLSMMRRALELEARLIDDLLDVTRIERGRLSIRPEPLDVNEAIAEVARLLAGEAGRRSVTLSTRREARAAWIQGDPARIRQVLWNLVINALKYSSAGGRIIVRSDNPETGALEIMVHDTGRGMEPHVVASLFGAGDVPQADQRVEGLGLGLKISKAIVEAHGGAIRGASAGLGQGSTFTVVLPGAFDNDGQASPVGVSAPAESFARDAASPAPRDESADPGLRESADPGLHESADPRNGAEADDAHVLLIEDDVDTSDVMSMLLGMHGYRVSVVHTADEAVRAASERRWRALISDIRLPDGSGWELMRRIPRGQVHYAIAVSGFGSQADLTRSLEAGFDEHMVKPVNIERLLATLARSGRE